jgi:4-amino-4-deoxy-L-arabinose transferase-like glycosyltransferase
VLAAFSAGTDNISTNEAWFASPAVNLINKGFLGTTILEPAGTWLAGIERHTYWVPPAHLLLQSCCYKLFGFSLCTLRSISIFWGFVTLVSLGAVLWKLCGRRDVIWLAVALLAIDGRFLTYSSLGRMDSMCGGLGFASWAAYLWLRERSLGKAVLVSHSLAAASCLTHPCGVLYAGGLAILAVLHDRARLRFRDMFAAAIPYVIGLSAWGIYILQDPVSFHRQFIGNVSGFAAEYTTSTRWSGLLSPLTALKREYFLRYGSQYGWYGREFSLYRVQLLVLAAYTLGVVGALMIGSVRRHPGFRTLLLLGTFFYCALSLFEGLKALCYIVHTLPFCAALLAISALQLASRGGGWQRRCVFMVLAALASLQLTTNVRGYLVQTARWDYASAADYLRRNIGASDKVVGPAEFAFDLGFDSNLVDDVRLGYHSGRKPDIFIENALYRSWRTRSADLYPRVHAYLQQLLPASYELVFHNPRYSIYRRRYTSLPPR